MKFFENSLMLQYTFRWSKYTQAYFCVNNDCISCVSHCVGLEIFQANVRYSCNLAMEWFFLPMFSGSTLRVLMCLNLFVFALMLALLTARFTANPWSPCSSFDEVWRVDSDCLLVDKNAHHVLQCVTVFRLCCTKIFNKYTHLGFYDKLEYF